MIAIRPLLASLLLCVIVLAGHPSSAQAQEAPLLKRLYGFDQADPPADLPQIGPIAAAIDGSLVNLMGSESAGPSRLRRFSADGRLLAAWAGTGGHEGRLERPQDVAVTTAGDVWVLDLHWLHRFAADGTWLDTLPWPPDPHAADGTRLADGAGGRLAARPDGGLAASERDGHIWLLDREGVVTGSWVSAEDHTTLTLGPTDLTVLSDGSIAVAHLGIYWLRDTPGQSQLRRFAPDGRLLALRRFGPLGDEPYRFLYRVTAEPDGSVLNLENGKVQRRDGEGRLLAEWSVANLGEGDDLAAALDGTVFVRRARTLLHLGADGRLLAAWGEPGGVGVERQMDTPDAVGSTPAPDGRLFTFRSYQWMTSLRWLTPLGHPAGPPMLWPLRQDSEPFGLCPVGGGLPCQNRMVVNSDHSLWATDGARGRILHLTADGSVISAETPLDAEGQPVAFFSPAVGPRVFGGTSEGGVLLSRFDGGLLYRYDADLTLLGTLVPQHTDAFFLAAASLVDGGTAALEWWTIGDGGRAMALDVSAAGGAVVASVQVPPTTIGLAQAPDQSLWLFPSGPDGIARFSAQGIVLPHARVEVDASLRPRSTHGVISGGTFGPDGRLYTGTEVYGFDDPSAWRVRLHDNPWFSGQPLSISAWATLRCSEGCRDPRGTAEAPGASLIAERATTVAEGQALLVHARGDLRLWVDESLVVDQRSRSDTAIDRIIRLGAGRHRLEVEFAATDEGAELAVELLTGSLSRRAYLPSVGG